MQRAINEIYSMANGGLVRCETRVAMMARYSQLITYFRERILDGSLPPGMRLPTELEIAQEHQISRGTVRHALSALVNEGLIERVQGRGTFVRQLPPAPSAAQTAAEKRIGLLLHYMD